MTRTSSRALIAIDFVNEIIDPKGKLSGKGYADFLDRHDTLSRVEQLFGMARAAGLPLFHIHVGFSPDYLEQPEHSPLFGAARKHGIFKLGAWGTEFHSKARPINGEREILKHRVSAFYGTPLDLILRNAGITELLIAGVATDLAVQSTTREAHDRGYSVTVIGDCCASSNDRDHEDSLRLLSKVATVKSLSDLEFRAAVG